MSKLELKIPLRLEIKATVGLAIRYKLESEKISQKAAAEMCGLFQPRISDLVNGKLDLFTIDSLVDIADALSVQVDTQATVK